MVVTGKNAENYILSENVEKSGRQIFICLECNISMWQENRLKNSHNTCKTLRTPSQRDDQC